MKSRQLWASLLATALLIPASLPAQGHHGHCDPETAVVQPLLSVPDVNADGQVDQSDRDQILLRISSVEGDPAYYPLYDINADGQINGLDYMLTANHFGAPVPLVDTQVAAIAIFHEQYRDVEVAHAAGYVPATQYAVGHGYHYLREDLLTQPWNESPAGLNYGLDGKLTAVFWFVDATLYGDAPPEGFAGPEDMWHHHAFNCAWNLGGRRFFQLMPGLSYFEEQVPTNWGVTWPTVTTWGGAQVPTCEHLRPKLEKLGRIPQVGNPSEVRDYQWDKFHMLHLWINDLNPCGRFFGTHPDE